MKVNMNTNEARLHALGFKTVDALMDHYENIIIGLVDLENLAVHNAHKTITALSCPGGHPLNRIADIAVHATQDMVSIHAKILAIKTRE